MGWGMEMQARSWTWRERPQGIGVDAGRTGGLLELKGSQHSAVNTIPWVRKAGFRDPALQMNQRTTRAPPPFMSFSTSFCVAIEVSPGVVEAKAPWAAP